MSTKIFTAIIAIAASATIAGAESPAPITTPIPAPTVKTTCRTGIQKIGMQCYVVEQCITETCDKTAGTCSWETSSKRLGDIPCF